MYRPRGLSYILISGAILAGVLTGASGGSVKAIFSFFSLKEQPGPSYPSQKIEFYWNQTGLNQKDLFELVNNISCRQSERYFLACVNSLRQNLLNKSLQLSAQSGVVAKATLNDLNQTEKKFLQPFISMYASQNEAKIDFESTWFDLISLEPNKNKQAAMIASGINGFLSVFKDPHTYIMPAKYQNAVNSSVERSRLFVGISFESNEAGQIFIRKIYKDSDAEKAGLKKGDLVIAFNQNNFESLNLEKISQSLRSEKQYEFLFKVQREDGIHEIHVKRSLMPIKYVQTEVVEGFKSYAILTLSKFTKGVCEEVQSQMRNVLKKKVSGLVLDLRDNPGGYLEEASCIAGLFIGRNQLVYSIQYENSVQPDEVSLSNSSMLYSGPLAVLVNSSSASASELLAGALKEYGRAILVGERTFGKGTFQEGDVWSKNSKINLYKTMGYYLLPNGDTTQLKGVEPDIYVQENKTQKREEDLYFRPLPADKIHSQNKVKKIAGFLRANEDHCIADNTLVNEDKIIERGLKIVACQSAGSVIASVASRGSELHQEEK